MVFQLALKMSTSHTEEIPADQPPQDTQSDAPSDSDTSVLETVWVMVQLETGTKRMKLVVFKRKEDAEAVTKFTLQYHPKDKVFMSECSVN